MAEEKRNMNSRSLESRKKAAAKRKKKKQRAVIVMLLLLILVLVLLVVVVFWLTGHKHTPGPAATCTTDQICEECEEILEEAHGHTPGPEATCTDPQVCSECGEVLAEALGHDIADAPTCSSAQTCSRCGLEVAASTNHDVDESGVCALCGEQVLPADLTVHLPGAGDAESDDLSGIIPEDVCDGHYNTSSDGYYSSNVMICGDYGIEYFNPNPEGCSAWANTINRFAEKYPELNVTAMIVPKSTAYNTAYNYENPHDAIAAYIANTYDLLNSSVVTPDAMGVMDEHAGEYMFYRTDHHWTSLGAYYASVAYCEANGITPYELESYETSTRTGFVGTLYNYGGEPAALKSNKDYTVFHYPHSAYTMQYYAGGWVEGKLFNTSTASYASAYIMGDQPVELYHTDNPNGKALMIFKESYGNCFAPYMLDYYSTVIVVDIRDSALSVQQMIADYGVTDVLFINNCQAVSSLNGNIATRCMD